MGIVNVTPDSFSDGGLSATFEAALAHARRLIAEGADILDIGGESTRPGAAPVSVAEELDRVLPVIEHLARETGRPISIDTLKPQVAEAAIRAGATIWNDVSGLGGEDAPAMAAKLGCAVVLMHMRGEPRTMQDRPVYADVVGEVERHLLDRAKVAEAAGVARDRIVLDPGIGFGKTVAHNLALMKSLPRLVAHGYPVLLGASRKRFIAGLDGYTPPDGSRLGGSVAAAVWAARSGCAMVRVHDVAETVQALNLWSAIEGADA